MSLRIYMIFLLTGIAATANAQEMNYTYADSLSYQLYLRNASDSLEQLTNSAGKNGIDFYYLQLRTGVLFYNKRMYQKAEKYFEQCLTFDSSDPVALEYLYYCYIYNGKPLQAENLAGNFPSSLKTKLNIRSIKLIETICLEGGGLIPAHAADPTDLKGSSHIYGDYDKSNCFYTSKMGIVSKLSPRIKLYNSAGFLNLDKSNSYQSIPEKSNNFPFNKPVPDLTGSSSYQTKQYEAFSHLSYLFKSRIVFTGAYHYIFTTSNNQLINFDAQKHSYFFTTQTTNIPMHAGNLGMTYFFKNKQVKTSFSMASVNGNTIKQINIGIVYALGSNKKIYASSNAGFFKDNNESKLIVQQKFGAWLSPKLKSEFNFTIGSLYNYIDEDAASIYYMTDNILCKSGLAFTYSFNPKISMGFSSDILIRESYYSSFNPDMNYTKTNFLYPAVFTSLKLIWKP